MTEYRQETGNSEKPMIFMTKSRHRRGYIARRIEETLDGTDPFAGSNNTSVDTEARGTARDRFKYQLPAWIALACIVAIPVVILVFLLVR